MSSGNVVCKANTQRLVPLKCDISNISGQTMIFEPIQPLPGGCLVGKSLHLVCEKIFCNVINATDRDEIIDPNRIMGKVSMCTEPKMSSKGPDLRLKNPLDQELVDIESLSVGANLTSDQVVELRALLLKYHRVFQWNADETTGRTNLAVHRINTGNAEPIMQRQYPIPQAAKQAMRDQVFDMLKKQIISESNSPWRSPILLIRKVAADGTVTYRFCIDLRKVNEKTVKDAYSLPRIDETVDALSGSKFFSTMDIDRAFWQVPLSDEDKQKTGFMVDGQLYEFNVMPFGACNAPATFQRLMDRVLRGLTWRQCLVYIDDVLVFATSFSAHLQSLDEVLSRVLEAGLKLKPSKCLFGTNTVDYLGYTVSDKGVKPSGKKIEALLKADLPRTTKLLNSFLCSLNYYRGEIPNFGDLTADLYDMANQKQRFCSWNSKAVKNFNLLRKALMMAPILAFPDFTKDFVIQSDASQRTIGGVCLQQHEIQRPVMFYGRKLSKVERRYSTTERELLAIVYGYKQCYHLVYGRKIIFLTDHEPLVKMSRLKQPFGRLGRLFHHLVDVNYEIKYIPGSVNYLADFMSRAFEDDADEIPEEHLDINLIDMGSSLDWIKEQASDAELTQVMECIKKNATDNDWLKIPNGRRWLAERRELYIFKSILKHGCNRTVVPTHLRRLVLEWYHDSPFAGHRGTDTVLASLRRRYFWLNLYSDTKEHCRTCVKCQTYNYATLHSRAPLKPIEVVRTGQVVGLDYMGPFKMTRSGNRYIVIAIDANDKWVVGVATKSFDALTSALFLFNEVICKHGMVERILTDQAQNFEADLFQHLCRLLGAHKIRSSAYHAQGNGVTERVNKVLKPYLAKFVNESHDNWDIYLQMAISSYNTSFHSSIGSTPFESHHGRPPVTVADVILNNKLPSNTDPNSISEFTIGLHANASILHKQMLDHKARAQAKQKLYYDRFVKNQRRYKVGDFVKLTNNVTRPGLSKAFERKFHGPYKIEECFDDLTFRLSSPNFKNIIGHYNRMEPYYKREGALCAPTSELLSPTARYIAPTQSTLTTYTFSPAVLHLAKKIRARRRKEASNLIVTGSSTSASDNDLIDLSEPRLENDGSTPDIRTLPTAALGLPVHDQSVRLDVNEESVYDDADQTLNENSATASAFGAQFSQALIESGRNIFVPTGDTLSPPQYNEKNKRTTRCELCHKRFESTRGIKIHMAACKVNTPARHGRPPYDTIPDVTVDSAEGSVSS